MLIIAINLSISGFDKSEENRIFSYSVYLAAFANICDFLWNLCLTGKVNLPVMAMYLIDFFYFISFGASALCWLIYTDMVQKNDILKNKKLFVLYFVPLAVLAVLLMANSLTGCLFYIDASGKYYRGTLFYAQQVLSYGYIVISAVKCFSKATSRKNYARRGYFLTLSTFVIPPIICGIIQITVQDIPVLSVGIVISYLLAYINLLERLISLDPLTGISNRREFLQRLEDNIKSLKATEDLYFLFIDIDSCGRYGGDEFALFVLTELNVGIESVCAGLEEYIEKHRITRKGGKTVTVSTGCSKYLGDSDDIQGLIFRADENMYSTKKEKRKMKNGENCFK